jgi:hypothetical protein
MELTIDHQYDVNEHFEREIITWDAKRKPLTVQRFRDEAEDPWRPGEVLVPSPETYHLDAEEALAFASALTHAAQTLDTWESGVGLPLGSEWTYLNGEWHRIYPSGLRGTCGEVVHPAPFDWWWQLSDTEGNRLDGDYAQTLLIAEGVCDTAAGRRERDF